MEIILVIVVLIIIVRCYIKALFSSPPIKKEECTDSKIIVIIKSYMKRRVEVTYPQWFMLCIGLKVFIFSVGAFYA